MTQIKIDTLQEYINLSDDETQKVIGGITKSELELLKERKKLLTKKYTAIAELIINCPATPGTEIAPTTTQNPSTTT